jgi:hypothetical protein
MMNNLNKLLGLVRESEESNELFNILDNPKESFIQRLDDAAAKTIALAKLAQQRRRIGFMDIGLSEYIQSLAVGAKINLADLLKQFQIESLHNLDVNAGEIARLSKSIGQSLNQTLIQIRIMFIKSIDENLVESIQPMRARGLPDRANHLKIEEQLDQIELQLDSQNQEIMRHIREVTKNCFQE